MTQRGQLICDELKRNGVDYVVWVPDSETHFMHDSMLNDPSLRVVQVCAEGEAVGICAGMHMGGKRGVVLIENAGAFDSGNALKWAASLKFPLVLLIGYLGYRNLETTPGGKMRRGQKGIRPGSSFLLRELRHHQRIELLPADGLRGHQRGFRG
ncbi:MAG: thiamine pyrophosphate-binding protein [Desulfobacterales bacterium]|nr:thiamine pyrophosphate-binding protein [Desulfobacterales bacterium]